MESKFEYLFIKIEIRITLKKTQRDCLNYFLGFFLPQDSKNFSIWENV